jgi:hypothetical protein
MINVNLLKIYGHFHLLTSTLLHNGQVVEGRRDDVTRLHVTPSQPPAFPLFRGVSEIQAHCVGIWNL